MKFSLGQVVATPGALEALSDAGQTPEFFLEQHVVGNWGEVDSEDWTATGPSRRYLPRLSIDSPYFVTDDGADGYLLDAE